jgi:hypothetical protein
VAKCGASLRGSPETESWFTSTQRS